MTFKPHLKYPHARYASLVFFEQPNSAPFYHPMTWLQVKSVFFICTRSRQLVWCKPHHSGSETSDAPPVFLHHRPTWPDPVNALSSNKAPSQPDSTGPNRWRTEVPWDPSPVFPSNCRRRDASSGPSRHFGAPSQSPWKKRFGVSSVLKRHMVLLEI